MSDETGKLRAILAARDATVDSIQQALETSAAQLVAKESVIQSLLVNIEGLRRELAATGADKPVEEAEQLTRAQPPEAVEHNAEDMDDLRGAKGDPANYLGQETDVQILKALAPMVQTKFFVDVGAEKGALAALLCASGMRGALFEPLDEHRADLEKMAREHDCAVYPFAIDEYDGVRDFHVATDAQGRLLDYFHSLQAVGASEQFSHSITRRVTCRSIASLVEERVLPDEIGVLKIDTEGHDLFVLKGLGALRPELVVCEFFAKGLYAGWELAQPEPLIELMRGYGYRWYAAVKRSEEFEYVSAPPAGFLPGQWGNLFFLRGDLFERSRAVLSCLMSCMEARFVKHWSEVQRDRVAKEKVIQDLLKERSSSADLGKSAEEKERLIRQLEAARRDDAQRADQWLADSKEKQAVTFSLRDHAEAADRRSCELLEAIEGKERHLQELHGELALHQERHLEAIRIMEEKEKVIKELSEAITQRDSSLRSIESVVARCAASIDEALRGNASALARAENTQREMLASMLQTRESLRELSGEKDGASADKLHNSAHVPEVLLGALEEKEQVIQELRRALDAYRASHPLLAYLGSPLRWIQALRKRAGSSVRNLLKPRLGNLNQHAPIKLRLPAHYARETPPKNPPRISIVTPSYKQAGFIERTITSVLDQKYPNLEYFVQDGGSDDGTCEILQRYSGRLSGWDSQSDGGQSHAINAGFSKTSGEIMAWLNSDDILYPGALAYVANYFAKHPEVDVVYGHRLLVDENDKQIGRWIMPPHSDAILSWADFVPQETLFWRRGIWTAIGGHVDESFRFAMDWDLLVRFRDAGARFVRLPRVLGGFRIHTQQKTSATISDVGFKEMDRIRARALGQQPSSAQINAAIAPYLARHIISDWYWSARRSLGGRHKRLGLVRHER